MSKNPNIIRAPGVVFKGLAEHGVQYPEAPDLVVQVLSEIIRKKDEEISALKEQMAISSGSFKRFVGPEYFIVHKHRSAGMMGNLYEKEEDAEARAKNMTDKWFADGGKDGSGYVVLRPLNGFFIRREK